jgi:hypothetical protein
VAAHSIRGGIYPDFCRSVPLPAGKRAFVGLAFRGGPSYHARNRTTVSCIDEALALGFFIDDTSDDLDLFPEVSDSPNE